MSGLSPLEVLFAFVFLRKVQSNRTYAHEEEEAPQKEKHNPRDPNGIGLMRTRTKDHEHQAQSEYKSRDAATEQAQVEVPFGGLLLEVRRDVTRVGYTRAGQSTHCGQSTPFVARTVQKLDKFSLRGE